MSEQQSISKNERILRGILKWGGAVFGIIGAFLVASNIELSGWGYIPFFTGAVMLVVAFWRQKEWSMVVLHGVYGMINLYGIVRWLL